MAQAISFRSLFGLLSFSVAMFALFGASPLKGLSATLQRVGMDWHGSQKNASASSAEFSTSISQKTPVYFFSHGGVRPSFIVKGMNYLANANLARRSVQHQASCLSSSRRDWSRDYTASQA